MKRFTETSKWEDPWFRRLKPEIKLLWFWILDHCDHAGVIDPDLELASFQIGFEYTLDSLSALGERIEKIGGEKWMVTKFIAFQYGELSPACKAHNPVFASLEKHKIQRVSKGYPKGIQRDQDKDIYTDKDKDKDGKEGCGEENHPTPENKPESAKPTPAPPTRKARPKDVEEALAYAANLPGYQPDHVRHWYAQRDSQGWLKASNMPVTNWRSDLDVWVMNQRNRPTHNGDGTQKTVRQRETERTGIEYQGNVRILRLEDLERENAEAERKAQAS
jgi:hypothetical protein